MIPQLSTNADITMLRHVTLVSSHKERSLEPSQTPRDNRLLHATLHGTLQPQLGVLPMRPEHEALHRHPLGLSQPLVEDALEPELGKPLRQIDLSIHLEQTV